ncbi:MAG: porin [Saprospiraceae bacterium]|nr:porin [Saprospiraceae bacterium]
MRTLLLLGVLFFSLNNAFTQEVKDTALRLDQYGKVVKRVPLGAEARNGILVFESADQDYKLWFDFRLNIDGQVTFGEKFNEIGDGASLRRARLAVKADISKNWYGELDLSFNNAKLELKDAYVSYDFQNGLVASLGNFKQRFSMSRTESSRYVKFMERSMAINALSPNRSIGLDMTYEGKRFFAVGGIFFQEIEDAEKAVFVEDNNKDFGRDQGTDLLAKLVIQPFGDNKKQGLHLGYTVLYRTPKTEVAPGEYGFARYSNRSLSNINRKKFLDTDLIADFDHSVNTNIELAAYHKGLNVVSEILSNRTFRKNNKESLDFGGFYVQAAYLLFGGNQVYNKGEAEFTQPNRGKSWGDIEIALRYDYITLNDKDVLGGSGEGITAGINFYTAKNVKFMLNYSIINHDRYASGKGKIFVGEDVTGALTKDPKKVANATGNGGEDYSQLGVRCEIAF